ncbi:hypothetical protein QE152_g13940 [Popillia japonica]|uniref:Endonuclease/exonuclease/phosphatase domain-containing protein n=1 Tax=Popillia japonica TaxID=7064 RepID=A0AAW1LBR7_POPJA
MNPKKHNQSRGLRILQTNLNRMRAAHDMAFVTAVDLDIDVVVVSEPNKKIIEGKRWCKDKRQDVAILFHNQKTRIKRLDIGEGMIAIHFQSFVMYCVYCSPNINLDQFKQEMELDMTVINKGDKPTFVRGAVKSFIDVTCSTRNLTKRINNWNVLETECISDHSFIYFEVAEDVKICNSRPNASCKINCNWEVFNETMSWNLEIEPNTVSLEGFEKIVKGAYRGACFSKEVKSRLQPYWWNEDIDKKRRECTASRRLVTRQKHKQGDTRFDLEPNQKKDIIRSLFPERRLARTERALDMEVKWFKQEELERAAQSLRSGKAPGIDGVPPEAIKRAAALAPEVLLRLMNELLAKQTFPRAAQSLRSGKAPGIDGVPPEAIKRAAALAPEVLLRLMNELLAKQTFPKQWKEAKLVLIPKSKPEDMKFRPICLLNSSSKLFEAKARGQWLTQTIWQSC